MNPSLLSRSAGPLPLFSVIAPRLAALAVFAFVASLAPAAEPLAELARASGLGGVDAQRLKAGEIINARGTKGSFAHGVYIESCFFVREPPAAVGAALMQWDPSKHPEEEVAAYQIARAPAAPDCSRVARLKSTRGADRWLENQSAAVKNGKTSSLHLSPAEAGIFRQETGGANAAWERVLRARAEAVAAGGLAAAGDFPLGDGTISAPEELRGLLGMTPAISALFGGVTGMGGDRWLYAERASTQGHTSFSLGTLTAQAGAESWQIMDCTYYTSDTYFMSVDLYYLWAWEGGTLVWQVDYVSAPFRAYAHGLDKIFAGREMIKETAKSIESFRGNGGH